MNSKISYLTAMLFMVACSANLTESEDAQYQKYVDDTKAQFSKANLSPLQRSRLYQQHYAESGLEKFINRTGEQLDGQIRNISDLKEFYNTIIVDKYAGHAAQGHLKTVFITYAVTTANLTAPENTEEGEFLVSLTKDLVEPETSSNPTLILDCLNATEGRVGTEEFNEMVRKGKFKLRLYLEETKIEKAAVTETAPPQVTEELERVVEQYEHALTAVAALAVN